MYQDRELREEQVLLHSMTNNPACMFDQKLFERQQAEMKQHAHVIVSDN
jgi:hypothetical protein